MKSMYKPLINVAELGQPKKENAFLTPTKVLLFVLAVGFIAIGLCL